jgi:hypothetical protein
MIHSNQPLAETVVPDSTHETWPQPIAPAREIGAAAEMDPVFVSAPRRILHAAIRFGKSFEFVFECCVF